MPKKYNRWLADDRWTTAPPVDGNTPVWNQSQGKWLYNSGSTGGVVYVAPAIVLGTAAAVGVANSVIRSDATIIAFDATVPVTQAFGDAAATGSAAVASRRDHKHGMPASPSVGISEDAGASLGNITKIDFGGGFDVSFAAGVGTVTLDVDESPLSGLAKLVGRSGGQSLAGDTLTTGNLTLRANQADTTGTVIILSNVKMGTASTTIQDSGATARIALATSAPVVTLTGATQVTGETATASVLTVVPPSTTSSTGLKLLDFPNQTIMPSGGTTTMTGIAGTPKMQVNDASTGHVLYGLNFNASVTVGANTTAVTWANIFGASATVGILGAGSGRAATVTQATVFDSNASFTVLSTGTVVVTNFDHFRSHSISLSAAKTIATFTGLRVDSQVITNITNFYPLYIDGPATTTQGSVHRNSVQVGSVTRDYGGGDGVIGLTNATTAPTANPTTGTVLASVGQQLVQRGVMSVNEPIHSTVAATAAGTAYNTSTTETALNNAIFTFPANSLVAGSVWRLTARGVYGTKTATTPTFDMRCRWGGVAGVLLGDSGANNMGLGVTNLGWKVEFTIRVVSIGATGTFEAQGEFAYSTSVIALNDAYMVNTAVVTVDTTASKDLVLTGQWGTNDATNTIIVRNFIVERVS